MSRTAPIYSYNHSGPRSVTFSFDVHRDLFTNIKYIHTGLSNLLLDGQVIKKNINDDYIDIFLKEMQGATLPVYGDYTKMVNPPIVAVRFGNDIFIKGVITNQLQFQYKAPVLKNGKYAMVYFIYRY